MDLRLLAVAVELVFLLGQAFLALSPVRARLFDQGLGFDDLVDVVLDALRSGRRGHWKNTGSKPGCAAAPAGSCCENSSLTFSWRPSVNAV